MTDSNGTSDKAPLRKYVIAMFVGGLVGFATMLAVSKLTSLETLSGLSISADVAIIVGVFYVLMAVVVAAGSLKPKIGSKILNVEDAEELEEQRTVLLNSGASMTLWGLALIVIALGGPGGILAMITAFAVAVLAMVTGSYFAWISYKSSDELMKAVNAEATAVAFVLLFVVNGGWAMAAHVELVQPQEPINVLTVFYAVVLLATLIAAGRRGMLNPR